MNREKSICIIKWKWSSFENLSTSELYGILKLRQEVFIVEQKCIYLDCDGLDNKAWHLTGILSTGKQHELVAYLRIILPGIKTEYASFGRLLTHKKIRKKGIGSELLKEAISYTNRLYPGSSIQISAQLYLESFYKNFGFVSVSEPYDEDGIAHIEMIKS